MDFLVDVIISGTVRGADAYCTPEEVESILGSGFVVNRGRNSLSYEYGSVDFYWTRRTSQDRWSGTWFGVSPPDPPPFGPVRAAVEVRGFSLRRLDSDSWWQPESAALIRVEDDRVHRVWAPHQPRPAKEFPSLNKQAVTHLRSATPAERESWLAKRLPASEDRLEWWRCLLATIRIREHERHGPDWPWLPLYRWALSRAELPPHEHALLFAAAVPDEAARVCAAALPPATAGTTPEAVRSTRIRRALLTAMR
ncbi:hypothetical protein NLX83_27275 [Allokutzneria sp. A3M-2-11 16]|uniref:hypothetical protein n=1 Tax=Allokutzneria sp. A3M-2-11 16 TaxID=2962043 RepID=UPI0020B7980F|nr:hypothetical protein [Allokutzneria sp. A3M-2-11 16]MCP3802981.1 hypothetical protein [Allokutzneria sp. A3M-2-11 16]